MQGPGLVLPAEVTRLDYGVVYRLKFSGTWSHSRIFTLTTRATMQGPGLVLTAEITRLDYGVDFDQD